MVKGTARQIRSYFPGPSVPRTFGYLAVNRVMLNRRFSPKALGGSCASTGPGGPGDRAAAAGTTLGDAPVGVMRPIVLPPRRGPPRGRWLTVAWNLHFAGWTTMPKTLATVTVDRFLPSHVVITVGEASASRRQPRVGRYRWVDGVREPGRKWLRTCPQVWAVLRTVYGQFSAGADIDRNVRAESESNGWLTSTCCWTDCEILYLSEPRFGDSPPLEFRSSCL